jgi:PRTRC genetic system ThiF family protein
LEREGFLMKCLPKVYSLHEYPEIRRVLVLGCGGTGAYVISHLARFLSVASSAVPPHRRPRRRVPSLFIADGDFVEEKNLIRQHFIYQDVGKNKAEVLAERYSAAFGIDISVIPKDIEDAKSLQEIVNNRGESSLIIGCVDNNATRQLIHKCYFNKDAQGRVFWIDSGNEEVSGQVVCGFVPENYYWGGGSKVKVGGDVLSGQFSLPCATELYPEFLTDGRGFNSGLSCAERAESAPQSMMTNVTAATIVMNFAQTILMGKELRAHAVEFSIKNAFSTKLNTEENLRIVNPDRKREWEL